MKVKAFCIGNKRGDVLFLNSWVTIREKIFIPFFIEVNRNAATVDPPPLLKKDGETYCYILREEMYWICAVDFQGTDEQCGALFITSSLKELHSLFSSLCGVVSQSAVKKNVVLLLELTEEVMPNGIFQTVNIERLQPHLCSEINVEKPPTFSLASGLFGIERHVPSGASLQPVGLSGSSRKEIYVDVIEKVWASLSCGKTLTRAELSGSIVLRCYLNETFVLTLELNSNFTSTSPESLLQIVELGNGVDTSELDSKNILRITAPHGEAFLISYVMPITHLSLLPFLFEVETKQLSESDGELHMVIKSTTGLNTFLPHLTVKCTAPQKTTSISSSTSGSRNQTVKFSEADKTIWWELVEFPGGAASQAVIRLIGCGSPFKLEKGEIEFEVSKWTLSGLRVENLLMSPENPLVKKWVRYLTVAESVMLDFK